MIMIRVAVGPPGWGADEIAAGLAIGTKTVAIKVDNSLTTASSSSVTVLHCEQGGPGSHCPRFNIYIGTNFFVWQFCEREQKCQWNKKNCAWLYVKNTREQNVSKRIFSHFPKLGQKNSSGMLVFRWNKVGTNFLEQSWNKFFMNKRAIFHHLSYAIYARLLGPQQALSK